MAESQDTESGTSQEMTFVDACRTLRARQLKLGEDILRLKAHSALFGQAPASADKAEMIANIMLAYRHCEDLGMRLGKAIQAFDGGKSVYR